MQTMRIIETTSAQWSVFVQMRGVLLKAGAERKTRQEASRGNAGGHRALSRESWPGSHLGIRPPGIDETPLSESECWVAVREGLCNT